MYFAKGDACREDVGMGVLVEAEETVGMLRSSTLRVSNIAVRKRTPAYSLPGSPQPGSTRPFGREACTIIAQRVYSLATRRYVFFTT